MDDLLARLGAQAFNMAIRSGIAITSSYALQQCSRLLKTVNDKALYAELRSLQKDLNSKIKIISPIIDLVEFKSGRGNVFLESAVPLAKALRQEIISLGKRLDKAASAQESSQQAGRHARTAETRHAELVRIVADIKALLGRIDRDIPVLGLAITGSGESLSTSLSSGVSPSRMLQASTFLTYGDMQFSNAPTRYIQIGPSFTLSLYMLFLGHASKSRNEKRAETSTPYTPERPKSSSRQAPREEPYGFGEGDRKPLWQEVIHKARVRLCRTPAGWAFDRERGYGPKSAPDSGTRRNISSERAITFLPYPDEYSYHLEIIEDLDDGRVHDEDGSRSATPFDGVSLAGIRESMPIYQIAKIFYTDTGKILNIGNASEGESSPVLLMKRDINAPSPVKLREAWANQAEDAQYTDGESDTGTLDYEQVDIDRQLREESEIPEATKSENWSLPQHLDPEWLALEVYSEDHGEESSGDEEASEEDSDEAPPVSKQQLLMSKLGRPRDRSSFDSKLLAQLRDISIRSSPEPSQPASRPSSAYVERRPAVERPRETTFQSTPRSPFGAITSSLSLMEMLIRLASLQEFQQTSHLSIPDHILTFFLEETSTTGLRGEARWKVRNEAKRRVGFDPYLDTPEK